MSEPFSIGIWL